MLGIVCVCVREWVRACVCIHVDCKFMIQLVLLHWFTCVCQYVHICIANSNYTFIWKSNQVEHVWCRLLKVWWCHRGLLLRCWYRANHEQMRSRMDKNWYRTFWLHSPLSTAYKTEYLQCETGYIANLTNGATWLCMGLWLAKVGDRWLFG